MSNTEFEPDPLKKPVMYLKGVGPQRAELLHHLGFHKAADLLFNFPRDYLDMSEKRTPDQLQVGQLQSVEGVIEEWERRNTSRGEMLSMTIECGEKYLKGIWFKMPYMIRDFAKGRRVMMTGKPKFDYPFWIMMHPQLTYLTDAEGEDNDVEIEPLLPVYSLTEGLKQHHLRKIMRELLPTTVPLLEEVFPVQYLQTHRLLSIAEAVRNIHFPADMEKKEAAKRRFVYQELFVMQLALASRRLQHRTRFKSVPLPVDEKVNARIRQRFPFALTKVQDRAIKEICNDMSKPIPMNRLLQGDVGSGKTVVALYAMLVAVANGHQAVFMSPTEVLARQHCRTIERMLEGSQVKIAQLFGGQKTGERAMVLQNISCGAAQIIIGTQAIIQNEIPFQKLGLVVIDEQHKFGVRQRAALKSGETIDPHYLVMTATPIPRSVAMTLFGDLDVSVLDAMPPGRQKVHTYFSPPEQRPQWFDFVARKIAEGQQGFVVVPAVEESELADVKNLQEVYQKLVSGPFKDFKVGMIHGRMSSEEKDRIMFDFRTGITQLLVATTVIEVGVDVPNANLLTIESGERFGLSQLHQLRGRIGRGKQQGFCTVFANAQSEESIKRLKAFVSTTNGFKLAEKDFEIRGSGDLFGTQQHGLPPLLIADLIRDRDILTEARRDAEELIQADPGLALPEHAKLRRQMLRRYGAVLDLGDVG